MSASLGDLRGQLQDLAAHAGRGLRRARARAAAIDGLERAARHLWVLPLLGLGCALVGLPASPAPLFLAGLGVLALAAGGPALRAGARAVPQQEALAVVDERLALSGRLQVAGEFLERARRTPFIVAALEDAATWVRGARGVDLVHPVPALRRGWLGRRLGGALALYLAFALVVPGPFRRAAEDLLDEAQAAAGELLDAVREQVAVLERDPIAVPEPDAPEPRAAEAAGASELTEDPRGDLSEREKESQGSTGQGRSAEANSTSSDSSARGAPSDQAQPSQEPEKRPKPGKKPVAKPRKQEAKPRSKEPEPSATTTGSGSSKGSGRNPTASEWSSPEQAPAPDDAEIDQDEEVDDDEEEQESRGGVQPSLRDRRPPVSRDLRIGFGNRPNPDANGRGGPSEQKKSRGVASLVLGVPIPDRVKGRPGPGRTKVTQERVLPKAEDAAQRPAQPVTPRTQQEGRLPELDLEPWVRGMVRDYFQRLRQGAGGTDPRTNP